MWSEFRINCKFVGIFLLILIRLLRCLGWIEFWLIKLNKMIILGEAYIFIVSSLKIEDLVLEYIRYGIVYFGFGS